MSVEKMVLRYGQLLAKYNSLYDKYNKLLDIVEADLKTKMERKRNPFKYFFKKLTNKLN